MDGWDWIGFSCSAAGSVCLSACVLVIFLSSPTYPSCVPFVAGWLVGWLLGAGGRLSVCSRSCLSKGKLIRCVRCMFVRLCVTLGACVWRGGSMCVWAWLVRTDGRDGTPLHPYHSSVKRYCAIYPLH